MRRTIPFDSEAKCDWCGKQGAFDFMGDFICENCIVSVVTPDELQMVDNNIEDEE